MNSAGVRRAEISLAEAREQVRVALEWVDRAGDGEAEPARVALEDIVTRLDRASRILEALRVEAPERDGGTS